MWLDYKQYKHYQLIEELNNIACKEKDEYVNSGKDTHVRAKENERKKLGMGEHQAPGWDILPVMRNGKVTEYADDLPNIKEKAMTIPGLVNCTLNVYHPGFGAPPHSDYDYDMREDVVDKKLCYVILLGVGIPSSDPLECGFDLGGDVIGIKTGDIIAFDGGVIHSSWNNTKEFRYTINMDLEQSFWTKAI